MKVADMIGLWIRVLKDFRYGKSRQADKEKRSAIVNRPLPEVHTEIWAEPPCAERYAR